MPSGIDFLSTHWEDFRITDNNWKLLFWVWYFIYCSLSLSPLVSDNQAVWGLSWHESSYSTYTYTSYKFPYAKNEHPQMTCSLLLFCFKVLWVSRSTYEGGTFGYSGSLRTRAKWIEVSRMNGIVGHNWTLGLNEATQSRSHMTLIHCSAQHSPGINLSPVFIYILSFYLMSLS